MMYKKAEDGEALTGNARYHGFCIDLLAKIAEMLNFKYEIREEEIYGVKDDNGKWNGMIGQLISGVSVS